MPRTTIRMAETDADFDAARALSLTWAKSHLEDFPEFKHLIEKVFDPVVYGETVANLHFIHARPKGGILLAELDNNPVGCVMYHEMEPGVAEIKRLFVDQRGRGHGLGQALLTTMFKQMAADSYSTVRFSSAKFLTHARKLYESVGFSDIPQPDTLPEFLRDFVYFMERPLETS